MASNLQEQSAEAPTLGCQAWPLLALTVAPEVKFPLGLIQSPELSDKQGVLQTLEIPQRESPKPPGSCQVPSPGEAEGSQPQPCQATSTASLLSSDPTGASLPPEIWSLATRSLAWTEQEAKKEMVQDRGREGAAWGPR